MSGKLLQHLGNQNKKSTRGILLLCFSCILENHIIKNITLNA
jgi:hypothetical protein